MKHKLLIIILLTSISKIIGQSEVHTTQEINENVNTTNNLTKINLFTIDFNETKIPIDLIYNHVGLKPIDKPKGIGMVWELTNLGEIKTILNDITDSDQTKGWFNTPNPDFSFFEDLLSCNSDCPPHPGQHNWSDLSPDFYSFQTINGNYFDFFYKKNTIGLPTPVFLSNNNGYKLNTNFNNFACSASSPGTNNIVFNIIDKFGTNYDFINGPSLLVGYRYGNNTCRNNFYVKKISNPKTSDFIEIEYHTVLSKYNKFYSTGYNNYNNYVLGDNADYNNNISKSTSLNHYEINNSRLDIKIIKTNKLIVDISYLENQFGDPEINEININDNNGNYVSGYKFEYEDLESSDARTLYKIKKYNNDKSIAETIYEFQYNRGQNFFNDLGHYEDYMGFNNSIAHPNLLPFKVRDNNNNLQPAGDYTPNLIYAKQYSLFRIINKFSGITEFDYQLNYENNEHFGNVYGGGLLISTKKSIPNIGKSTLTSYKYENLVGFSFFADMVSHHFRRTFRSKKFFSSIAYSLDETQTEFGNETVLYNIHSNGNFFSRVTEFLIDPEDMSIQSKIIKEYIPNYEGLYRSPLLKREMIYTTDQATSKTVEYNYSYTNSEIVDRAIYRVEIRQFPTGIVWSKFKDFSPIRINRINLISINEIFSNDDFAIRNTTNFTYINPTSKILRSKTQSTSTAGESIEEKYYYANDLEMQNEPFSADLATQNNIGTPIKIETYRNTEKLTEQRTVYERDITTSNLLLPKYIYAKKGTDTNASLERKVRYDLYDASGNLLQYTPENGTPVSIIWGYKNTQPIAVLENKSYNTISPTDIINVQNKSNNDNDHCTTSPCTGNEEILRLALNNLRTIYPDTMITTYTYDPLIGVTSKADAKEDVLKYNYDSLGRLQSVKDRNDKIISENEYHFIPQN